MITILCIAVVINFLFVIALAMRPYKVRSVPKLMINPTAEQVNGVVEVYEILGMYEGPIQ